ncbi:hypothetical protein [Candidatus Enterococcus ferrettii]|uniref:Gram-positive cocci surface proteins LPxTG domain-containing protein n=1 Tax=Candidatus Enterococcus ferrettii TaxID=2815324 RepID=A0ABV0EUJ7_9ENTE|nr:hypothetical protein [Enterococcus sp. 665A]MBO1339386.1 hypothetical protein [Enterococcus sp. 665A]
MKKLVLILLLGIIIVGILAIAHDTANQISSQGIFEKKLNVQAGGKGNNASILVIGLALAGAAGSFYRYTKSED